MRGQQSNRCLVSPLRIPSPVPPPKQTWSMMMPCSRSRSILAAVTASAFLYLLLNQPLLAQKKSVKPGINKSFENPDVGDFVERFEREGREVYTKRHQVVELCQLDKGAAIADVGAGTGLYSRLFAKHVGEAGRVYAVDISKKFVDHVEATSRKEGLNNVVGVVCRQDSCDLEPASVDAVFICDTYHHFEFPQKTMKSIYDALRPGGRLFLIDFVREEGESSDWILNHVRAGEAVVRKEIASVGFEFVDEKEIFEQNYFLQFRKPE
jgi:ubiquinone/menaquinone biosynthesis C-methylase UbiE